MAPLFVACEIVMANINRRRFVACETDDMNSGGTAVVPAAQAACGWCRIANEISPGGEKRHDRRLLQIQSIDPFSGTLYSGWWHLAKIVSAYLKDGPGAQLPRKQARKTDKTKHRLGRCFEEIFADLVFSCRRVFWMLRDVPTG
jgi:hypothetical protein